MSGIKLRGFDFQAVVREVFSNLAATRMLCNLCEEFSFVTQLDMKSFASGYTYEY